MVCAPAATTCFLATPPCSRCSIILSLVRWVRPSLSSVIMAGRDCYVFGINNEGCRTEYTPSTWHGVHLFCFALNLVSGCVTFFCGLLETKHAMQLGGFFVLAGH